MKKEAVLREMMEMVPDERWFEIVKKKGERLKFPMYINADLDEAELDVLELTQRSSNCLHRAGYKTIGDVVSRIDGAEDLMKIRNCGKKSVDEIMEKLFCYQYFVLKEEKKLRFAMRVLELNG